MVEVLPVETPVQLDRFLHFPWLIYHRDPYWVPPYLSQLRRRLDSQLNPFFQYASCRLFAAYRCRELVGTVAAIVNHQYNLQYSQRVGFFGFFETVDDLQVAASLVAAAAGWLREQGAECMRGPVNGAPTDEVGVLVAGRQTRPVIWEGHTPAYYQRLLENLGFAKYDDVYAYEILYQQFGCKLDNLPKSLLRVAQKARKAPGLAVRSSSRQLWEQDVVKVHHIYNVAFRTIPDHTDMTLEKFQSMARSILPFLDFDLALLAEIDGRAVGFAVAMPDINEALRHFNGHISPLGAIKFHWYLRRIHTACFKLLGVLPEFRGQGIEALLVLEMAERLVKKNFYRVEMSLASEKNDPINRFIQRMGGRIYRQYRIYQREIYS